MNLDSHTLSLAVGTALLVQIFVLFLQSRHARTYPGAGMIAWGLSAAATGFLITPLSRGLLAPAVAGVLTATFVHIGMILVHGGVLRVITLPVRWRLLTLIFFGFFAAQCVYLATGWLILNQISNMIGMALYLGLAAAFIIAAYFRGRLQPSLSAGLIAGLFVVLAGLIGLRAVLLAWGGSDGSVDKPGTLFALLYFAALIGSLLFSFSVITLINDRAISDLHATREELEQARDRIEVALEESRRSNTVKSQFLAAMSHELRTPMHGILGMVRHVLDAPNSSTDRTWLKRVVTAGEHLLSIINDILDFSKLESASIALRDAPLDIVRLVLDAHELALAGANAKGLSLKAMGDLKQPLWLRGDPGRLRQIILNLLGNATKFTEQGSVSIELIRAGERVEIRVSDTGAGIAPQEQSLVFEPFYQADLSSTRQQGGTGLGLPLSRDLARRMGGDIVLESEPGRGSTFVFHFPFRAATAPLPEQSRAADLRPLRGRILLAEDNESASLLACAILDRMGLETQVATNGAAALRMYAEAPPDLVLMDNQMPGMDGAEAARRIRQHERDTGLAPVPIIALTADAFDEDRNNFLAAGMNEHLPKPFRKEQLWEVLARYLPERESIN